MNNLRIRAALACRLVNLDRVKFNEAVAAGAYPCAPITVKGSARLFNLDQLLGLYFFARLMEFGLSATRSGAIACTIAEKASLDQYSEADRIILVQGTDYSEVFGSLIKSYSGDVTVGYDPDHLTKGFYYAGLGTVIFTVEFYISHVRKLLDEKIERERNILGEEEE